MRIPPIMPHTHSPREMREETRRIAAPAVEFPPYSVLAEARLHILMMTPTTERTYVRFRRCRGRERGGEREREKGERDMSTRQSWVSGCS